MVTKSPLYIHNLVVLVTTLSPVTLLFHAFVDLDRKFTKILFFVTTYVVFPALLTNSVMLMYWMEDPTQISVFVSKYSVVVQSNLLA